MGNGYSTAGEENASMKLSDAKLIVVDHVIGSVSGAARPNAVNSHVKYTLTTNYVNSGPSTYIPVPTATSTVTSNTMNTSLENAKVGVRGT